MLREAGYFLYYLHRCTPTGKQIELYPSNLCISLWAYSYVTFKRNCKIKMKFLLVDLFLLYNGLAVLKLLFVFSRLKKKWVLILKRMRDWFLAVGVRILNLKVQDVCSGVKLELKASVWIPDYIETIIARCRCVCMCVQISWIAFIFWVFLIKRPGNNELPVTMSILDAEILVLKYDPLLKGTRAP